MASSIHSSGEVLAKVTKKLINSVELCVDDNLYGYVKTHHGVRFVQEHRVVVRADIEALKKKGQVTLLSGGGSGHEPFAAGFIGQGMLTGAVAGSIFTSPSPSNITAAIRILAAGNPGGLLVLVCNYTGDRLTFGQAVERARLEDLKVEMVVVGEDCALPIVNKSVGRRGLCGMILIKKIAGALAESGADLEEIKTVITAAAENMGTIGISLSSCSIPGSGPLFSMGADEMELGLGVHGEAGIKRIKMKTASEIVETMITHMTNKESATHLALNKGDRVVVIINNLGGLTQLEMNIFSPCVIDYLTKSKEVVILRCYIGAFQTSLEMAGVAVGVMHVTDKILQCLDASTNAPAWQQVGLGLITPEANIFMEPLQIERRTVNELGNLPTFSPSEANLFHNCILNVCDSLEANEVKLNNLDSGCGDGDCGTTLKWGAQAVRTLLENGLQCSCPKTAFLEIAGVVSEAMGGCSGGLYSIFFTAASGAFTTSLTPLDWCNALESGTNMIMHYGGAEPGDRTMIDPLNAAHIMLRAQLEVGSRSLAAFSEAVGEAKQVCQQTASMRAKAGRASYVSIDYLTQPDAGATAITIILEAILETIKTELTP